MPTAPDTIATFLLPLPRTYTSPCGQSKVEGTPTCVNDPIWMGRASSGRICPHRVPELLWMCDRPRPEKAAGTPPYRVIHTCWGPFNPGLATGAWVSSTKSIIWQWLQECCNSIRYRWMMVILKLKKKIMLIY